MWVWIGYEICMITLEFKLCTNIMNYRDMPKEEAGGDPMGRSGGVKGDLFLWHYILLTRYYDGATITIFTL